MATASTMKIRIRVMSVIPAYCLLPTAYCLLPTAYCLLVPHRRRRVHRERRADVGVPHDQAHDWLQGHELERVIHRDGRRRRRIAGIGADRNLVVMHDLDA